MKLQYPNSNSMGLYQDGIGVIGLGAALVVLECTSLVSYGI